MRSFDDILKIIYPTTLCSRGNEYFFVTVLLGRDMIWVGYLFLELHKKISFLNVSASDIIFTKNLKTFRSFGDLIFFSDRRCF